METIMWTLLTRSVLVGAVAPFFIGAASPRLYAQDDLVAWGADYSGQVSGVPTGTFVSVAAGEHHSVAIRSDGTLVSWGANYSGEVSSTPSGTFNAIAAGDWHSVAIRN
jgi:hypothetical protein